MDADHRRLLRELATDPSEALALDVLHRALRAGDDEGWEQALAWLCDLSRWDGLGREAKRELGAVLAQALDLPFDRVQAFAQGDQRHEVLVFASPFPPPSPGEESPPPLEWSLIPGGEVELGWAGDLRAGLNLEPHALLPDFAGVQLAPERRGRLRPFLIERTPPDPVEPEASHADLVAALAAQGRRLPTPDEWEHACSGGSRALFRWGPRAPRGLFDPEHDLQAPNAFGLELPVFFRPRPELTTEPGLLRGGSDATWAPSETEWGWLELASAFEYRPAPGWDGVARARRVLDPTPRRPPWPV
ncbi:MAG: hypothetical protein AB7N76_35700 [Planctomycetota bacterium]